MTTLQDILPPLRLSAPRQYGNLSVISLTAPQTRAVEPTPLEVALRRANVRIGEMPGPPQVNMVEARNDSRRPLLMLAGEELVGARQNRILNASVWVDPQRRVHVPVSCVEQGRWAPQGGTRFRSSSTMYFPSGLSAHTRRVGQTYRGGGTAQGDQTQVWTDVQTRLQAAGVHSATLSMHAISDAAVDDAYASQLACGGDGFAMFVDGRLTGIELFCSRAYCAAVYQKYLRAYALDRALRVDGNYGYEDLEDLLARVRTIPAARFASAGSGYDVRFDCARFHGSALVVEDGRLAHLSVFIA